MRPIIFVSATSRDLGSVRKVVKEALLTLGCIPVEQLNFAPDSRTVREMLRARLKECTAVIHVAGDVYGSEPSERAPGEARRSYTQFEVDIARELGKPIYVFVCADGFAYDPHDQEPPDLQALQRAHRASLTGGDRLWETVDNAAGVERRVLALQQRVDVLKRELHRAKRRLGWGMAAAIACIVLLAGGLWLVARQSADSAAEMARLRADLTSVIDAYSRLQSDMKDLKLTPEQHWTRATESVAEREGIDPAALRSGIDRFVTTTNSDPAAPLMDRALADFAARNFARAAETAGAAATRAQFKREAAERLNPNSGESTLARADEREARKLQGQARAGAREYEVALEAYDLALAVTPRKEYPSEWAELKLLSGITTSDWAARSEGSSISDLMALAEGCYRAALEVFTRANLPLEWGRTQRVLAVALDDQGRENEGSERARLLDEAAACCRAALEVYSRLDFPQDWAWTQSSLADALRSQACESEGVDRAQLLDEAAACYRAALEVYTRADWPEEWAMGRGALSIALGDQARDSEGAERTRLLNEAVACNRSALEVLTRADLPQEWAWTQSSFAISLSEHARASEGVERARLLHEAVACFRVALKVFTREDLPTDWATTQSYLAIALRAQGDGMEGVNRARLLSEAVLCHRATLEVFTRADLPMDWATAQTNLATALRDQAHASEGVNRARLLNEASGAYRAALDVFTRGDRPLRWVKTQSYLAIALVDQARASTGVERTQFLNEAAACYRAALDVLPDTDPEEAERARIGLAELESEIRALDSP